MILPFSPCRSALHCGHETVALRTDHGNKTYDADHQTLYGYPECDWWRVKKSRQSGLGQRILQYLLFLNGEGKFPREKMPDAKTLVAKLRRCANFGLADEGVVL